MMDTLALGIHYGMMDFNQALKIKIADWPELSVLAEKVGKLRRDEHKQLADYQAIQTANKLTPPLASLVKTMMKALARKSKG
jgi:hypothetical protein